MSKKRIINLVQSYKKTCKEEFFRALTGAVRLQTRSRISSTGHCGESSGTGHCY